MDTARRSETALPARGRSGPLLALALAATTALSMLSPVAASGSTPVAQVVVTAAQDGAAGVASAVRAVLAAGGTVDAELPLIGGVSATLPAGAVLPPTLTVADDRRMELAGKDDAVGDGATVRGTLGLGAPAGEGAGITVAVVDTGVDEVGDLKGRVEHAGVVGGDGDDYGHGTFVAGLIAGSGAASGGAYAGVAPAARILDVRVARADGSSRLSLVLLGLQKVASRADVDVVNLSLSSGSPMPWQIDPLTRALESLWNDGKVVVVPSGNDATQVSSPGVHPALLTVGGLDENGTADRTDDVVAEWSGRGPTDQGDVKPDLVAPGRSVVSLRAVGSVADRENPDSRVGKSYFRGSGTSFSTALTSGTAAALVATRDLSPDQVKALVTGTAYALPGDRNATGAGGLDVAAAGQARTPNVASWATDDAPVWSDAWQELYEAFLDGDQQAAANSWSKLTKADLQWIARNWTARNWTARNWTARNWTANSWSDLGWTVTPGTKLEDWHALLWAAETWAARNWTARNWTADEWAARNWTDEEWAARNWTANSWSARNWTARNWTANSWSARNWTARNWTARNWTARNWSAVDWAS